MDYRINKETAKRVSHGDVPWIVDVVMNTKDKIDFKKGRCDVHTHGLAELGLTELQLTIAIPIETAVYIINSIGRLILEGNTYKEGDRLFGLFQNPEMPVGFMNATDAFKQNVLRIILPDELGNVSQDTAEGIYGDQCENPYIKLSRLPYPIC